MVQATRDQCHLIAVIYAEVLPHLLVGKLRPEAVHEILAHHAIVLAKRRRSNWNIGSNRTSRSFEIT